MKLVWPGFGKKSRRNKIERQLEEKARAEVDLKDLYAIFRSAVGGESYFDDWRKKSYRKFEKVEKDWRWTIELEETNASRFDLRAVSLRIAFALKTPVSNSILVTDKDCKEGEIHYRWHSRFDEGIGVAGDRYWKISRSDYGLLEQGLTDTLRNETVPWLSQVGTPADLSKWMRQQGARSIRWPLELALGHFDEVQRDVTAYVCSIPEDRFTEREIDWFVANRLIAEQTGEAIRRASMQIDETYVEKMQDIAASLSK